MNTTADVVVIGGGINGCCTAYYLAQRGVKNIVLVEKGHIASGPTGRSSGIVRQHYSHETLAAMARDSVQVWQNFEQQIGGSAGFVQCGVVFFAGEKGAPALRQAVAMHQRIGIKEKLVSADDLRRMEPALAAEDIVAAAYEETGGYADPALAATSFSETAARLGVEIYKRTFVTGLKIESGKMRAVITDKGEIATACAVNIAGPWGKFIAEMAGAHIPIKASRHPVIILDRPPEWRNPTPVWGDLINGWYFKPERDTAIMVGSLQDIDKEVDIEDHPTMPSYEETETYSAAILKRIPVMSSGLARKGWAGLYDVTPDWQPVIDRIPEVEGFYCACGFSGHGFKIGPAVGRIVAELVVDGHCSSYDIGLFRYSRFQEQRSSRGTYAFGIIG